MVVIDDEVPKVIIAKEDNLQVSKIGGWNNDEQDIENLYECKKL